VLILANLREHRRSLAGTILAIAVGVALIGVTLTVHHAARPRVQPRYAAAAALAVPPQAVDESGTAADRVPWSAADAAGITAALGDVPGVAEVIVDRAFYAQAFVAGRPVADDVAGDRGHGWSSARLAPYALVDGVAPTRPGQVVVDAALGIAPGAGVRINLAGGPRDFVVSGTVDGPGFFLTDAEAAAHDPGVRAIALLLDPGTTAGQAAVRAGAILGDRGSVLTGDERAALEPRFVAHRRFLGTQFLAALAVVGLFVTVFVVGATLALATAQRRREIALLRTIGATPAQVRRMILGEACGTGLLGALAGTPLGVVAAPLMRDLLVRLDVAPRGLAVEVTPGPLLTAGAIGVAVAVLGTWGAARSAATVPPLEALRDAQVEHRPMSAGRWISGGLALAVGVTTAVLAAVVGADDRVTTAMVAAMGLITAAALLAPVVISPVIRVLTWPFGRRSSSAAPMLIRAGLLTATRRAAATAAPIIAAVGFAVLLSGMVETMRVAYPAGETRKLAGQVLIAPDGTPGLSDAVVAAHPVGKAALPTRLFVDRPGRGVTVIDALGSRDPRWARPGEAVLGESTAHTFQVRAGERIAVTFADGRSETLQVSRVLPDDPARGAFVMSRDLVRSHDPSALTDTIFIPREHAPVTVAAGAAVHDAESFALADYDTDARLTGSLAVLLIMVAAGYSGLAVINSMAMSAHARRADLAVMRSAGGTVRQLVVISVGETALVVTVGAALGLAVTLPPLAGMASGLAEATGGPVSPHLNGGVVAAVVLGCLAVATAASAIVTWRSAQR
jgi:putative ABC transport system permease protein